MRDKSMLLAFGLAVKDMEVDADVMFQLSMLQYKDMSYKNAKGLKTRARRMLYIQSNTKQRSCGTLKLLREHTSEKHRLTNEGINVDITLQ